MPPLTPLVVVVIGATVALVFLTTLNANAKADSVNNNLPDPNFQPPPSLGSFGDAAIDFFFKGIQEAENSDPKYNNPLDLVIPNWQGQKFGEGISVFSTRYEGVNRGKFQLYLIGSNQSKVYNLDMTILDMANKWTKDNPVGWANTVARSIGTTTDVTLGDLFAGTAS